MSRDDHKKSSRRGAEPRARVARRLRGPDLAILEEGGQSLAIDRDLPRPAHGAVIACTRIDEEAGLLRGYTLLDAPAQSEVVGRIDKRSAPTQLRLESAIREGTLPLLGAEEAAHGQYARARVEGGQAQLIELLGETPDAALRIAAMIDEFQLPTQFDADTLQAAEDIAGPAELLPREDMRDKPFVTIDGADARDYDDAVLVERRGPGFRLYVAIADVSAHVRPGDALDRSARERGTSVYFPGRVIPMLPHRLADDLCSLRPLEDRAALVCEMKISMRGQLKGFRFFPALIRSQARLIYEEVAQALDGDMPDTWNRGIRRNLRNLAKLHGKRMADREARGALDFVSRELQVQLDDEGQVSGLRTPPRTVAHRIIEECMILANVAAARALRGAGQPFLARIHEPPSADKLAALHAYAGGVGLSLGGGEQPEPRHYAALLARAVDHPQADSIQLAVLQSLQQAVYAPSDAGHFGLALTDYAHFTSPIRRYPDLLVHRALYAMIGGPKTPKENWVELGGQCSMLERRADKAAWGVIEALKCDYLADKVGEVLPGRIGGVTEFGLFVELEGYGISGLLHISDLGNDYFVYESDSQRLRGRRGGQTFELGQELKVRIAAVHPAQRKIDLQLPSAAKAGGDRSQNPRRKRR